MKTAIKIFVMGLFMAFLGSCSAEKEKQEELALVQNQLEETQRSRDALEASMLASLDEIDKRIGIIKSQKGYLIFDSRSDIKNKKEQILNNIAMMDELISDNEKRITKLRGELKRVYSNNKELDKRITKYEEMNKEIALELTGFKEMLAEEKERNEKLTAERERLDSELSNREVVYENLQTEFTKAEKDAYTGYCVKGTRKELKKARVIEKKKFLELASPDKLSSSASPESFEKIDIRTTLQIPLGTKEAKIVTTHNENSYKWCDEEDGSKRLCIVDPSAFWQKSKYLVIETK